MKTELLECFIAVAQEGNITRAARQLHITQPALSRQLQNLEHEVGVQLLVRGKRHVALTEEGTVFLQRAQEIVELAEHACEEARHAQDEVRGTIRLGYPETTGVSAVTDVIESFSARYPHVVFDLYAGYTDAICSRLDTGLLDMAIINPPVDFARYDHIDLPGSELWGVLCSADSPMAAGQTVTAEVVASSPLILPRRPYMQTEVLGWLGKSREEVHVIATYNLLLSSATALVARRLGIAVCTESSETNAPSGSCVFVPLAPEHRITSALAWRRDRTQGRATTLFIEEAKTHMAFYTATDNENAFQGFI